MSYDRSDVKERAIDRALENCHDFNTFIARLVQSGHYSRSEAEQVALDIERAQWGCLALQEVR